MVKFITFVNGTHFLLLVFNDLKDVTHDVREESNTKHHDDDCCDHFNAANGVIISVTNGRKRSKCEIASIYKLLIFIVQSIFQYPSMFIENIFLSVEVFWNEKPKASKEIGNDKGNNNHSYQLASFLSCW